jgi:outer membrane protein OmpA-like peptidoglycan-associated protein
MFRSTIPVIAAATIVAACSNGQGPSERVGSGAAIGAVLGGITGAIVARDDAAGALVGAGIGAIAGAAVGDYLDKQEAALKRDLEGTGATVTNTGEELLVNLPSEVTFDFDSAAIKPQFVRPLAEMTGTLNRYPESLIDIIGHTDSVGTEAYNQALSQRRADSVANFMTNRGVVRERIVAYGQGELYPIASNETEAGRAQNRRVEIRITPITEG